MQAEKSAFYLYSFLLHFLVVLQQRIVCIHMFLKYQEADAGCGRPWTPLFRSVTIPLVTFVEIHGRVEGADYVYMYRVLWWAQQQQQQRKKKQPRHRQVSKAPKGEVIDRCQKIRRSCFIAKKNNKTANEVTLKLFKDLDLLEGAPETKEVTAVSYCNWMCRLTKRIEGCFDSNLWLRPNGGDLPALLRLSV